MASPCWAPRDEWLVVADGDEPLCSLPLAKLELFADQAELGGLGERDVHLRVGSACCSRRIGEQAPLSGIALLHTVVTQERSRTGSVKTAGPTITVAAGANRVATTDDARFVHRTDRDVEP